MKTFIRFISIALIFVPFLLGVLYSFTPWEPFRPEAALFTGVISSIVGIFMFIDHEVG